MYALFEVNGKQYKAKKGSLLKVDHLGEEAGTPLEFNSVLMVQNDKGSEIGAPYVKGAKIKTTVGETIKGTKIKVLKFKRRKGYTRTQGHRQKYTFLKVNEISV